MSLLEEQMAQIPIHDPVTAHQGQPVLMGGAPINRARAALVMIHGRGATAQSMLALASELPHSDFIYVAPQAADNTWYPHSFLNPIPSNEPYLSSALRAVGEVLTHLSDAGIAFDRMLLLGFSQGACLALEYAARFARRYGAVIGLSGGLIGPDGTPRNYSGSLAGTPVFLGCSSSDFHIPAARVLYTAQVLRGIGGQVTERLYPNMGHMINADELEHTRAMMRDVLDAAMR
jgi:predicted esterase